MEVVNEQSLCRLCLHDDGRLMYIFQKHTGQRYVPAKAIKDLLHIQVSETDGYPTFVCLKCLHKLTNIGQFKEQCLQSIAIYDSLLSRKSCCHDDQKETQASSASADVCEEDTFENCLIEMNNTSSDMCEEDPLREDTPEVNRNDIKVLDVYLATRMLLPKEGKSAQGKDKHICKESATSSITTKYSENHRLRTLLEAGAATADSCTRNYNRGDEPSTKRPKSIASAKPTLGVKLERCEMDLLHTVSGGVGMGDGGELKEEERGTAPEKGGEGRGRYECSHCGSVLPSKGSLARHLAQHEFRKCYQCEVCDKQFANKSALIVHIRKHPIGGKPYECGECSSCFTQFGHLNIHMRIHTGVKPYKCNECKASFADSSNLSAHMRIHTGEKPYKCVTCCKAFNHNSNLKRHLRVHTREKPFQCLKCSKRFSDKRALNYHLKYSCTQRKRGCKE